MTYTKDEGEKNKRMEQERRRYNNLRICYVTRLIRFTNSVRTGECRSLNIRTTFLSTRRDHDVVFTKLNHLYQT